MTVSLITELERAALVAIVTIPDAKLAVPLAKALVDGGMKFMEITFRNDQAAGALKALQSAKLSLHYGAGTVRSVDQAKVAVDSGAEFLLAPGLDDAIVKWASKHGMPFFPGVDSTLGIEKALGLGLNMLKMFPAAELGGTGWLKAMKDPYHDVRFLPTGGITVDNMAEYLRLPNVIAVGGTFLAPKDLILGQKFAEITAICKKAVATIAATRA